jgi:hypothetical protein
MHSSPLITREGGARIGCCTANCDQGRRCPVRAACELPEQLPEPRVRLPWRWIALAVAIYGGGALYLHFF